MDVCLTEDPKSGQPKAQDCPAKRNMALAEGVACGAAVTLPKGIQPVTCTAPASPCNAVAGLPSDCSKAEVVQTDYDTADLQVGVGVVLCLCGGGAWAGGVGDAPGVGGRSQANLSST